MTNPPTTPPIIGPTGVDFFGTAWPGRDAVLTHVVVEQESHDGAVREQVSSCPHAGQLGGSGGH